MATRRHCGHHIRKFKSSAKREQKQQKKQIFDKNPFQDPRAPSISPCRQRGGGRRRRAPEGGDGADKVAVGQGGLAVVGLEDPGGKNTGENANGFPQNAL